MGEENRERKKVVRGWKEGNGGVEIVGRKKVQLEKGTSKRKKVVEEIR